MYQRRPVVSAFGSIMLAVCALAWGAAGQIAVAAPVPGGTLDPTTIPKFVTPLVIPPVMKNTGAANNYDIAVRQFSQQILPGGIWNTLNGRSDTFNATPVWGYGPESDPMPTGGVAPAANSQFNYPSYTIETTSNTPAAVRWRNELVADPVACNASPSPSTDPACNYLPHLLPGAVDQTLHWANPPATGCTMGVPSNRTDCSTNNPAPYTGPVPIVTHVHGAHVDPHSDGYPEAWWLPRANNIPAGYVTEGSLFDDAKGQVPGLNLGYADYLYRNDQPATTIWYHDHTLGMTRLNVYAGPAGFWLVRGGAYDLSSGLPGPAPVAGQGVLSLNVPTDPVRQSIREIPVAIQDRSFNSDGTLFYPNNRLFFDTYPGPYTGSSPISTDIAPIWNPEAFFNTIVVNGVTWPVFEVAPALYRLRLLDGCNSRMLNLGLFEVDPATVTPSYPGDLRIPAVEYPFYQIGAEQGFLPHVVMVQTGYATPLPGNGTIPALVPALNPQQALLMGNAERADVLVDFRGLANGTIIRMINTAPDWPFGGFPDTPADPSTTGQIMQFVVNSALNGASPTDPAGATPAVDPWSLTLPAETPLAAATVKRNVSLNEAESGQVCVTVAPDGTITVVDVLPSPMTDPVAFAAYCAAIPPASGGPAIPMGPREANVGTVDFTNPAAPMGVPLAWTDETGVSSSVPVYRENGIVSSVLITENPRITGAGAPIEEWNIYNFTVDGHPVHMHLVRFNVINRQPIPGVVPPTTPFPQQPWETGFKDTVIAYPGEITTVRAKFDISGLYVWHCHIVEHEDNEMMRPYVVSEDGSCGPASGQIFISAPASNLCTTGIPTTVNGTSHWTWSCVGKNGGTTSAQCSANIRTYTVTAVAGANGILSPSTPSPRIVNHGSATSLIFEANPNYHVATVSGCGGTAYNNISNAVMDYTYTTGPVTGNCTVNATFAINSFAITTHITGPGTFVCSPSAVALGGSSHCTFSTGTGYYASNILDNAVNVPSPASPYLLTNVTAGHDITITFSEYYVRRVSASTPHFPYLDIASAYAAVTADGEIIETKAVQPLPPVTFNGPYAVSVSGGYNTDFSATTGMTTIASPVSFEGGPVTLGNVVIQ
ncbi:MAG: multicopper oxidase domain-containing protein [Nitrospiraceae bacterium]|nr:multicopper oxidase domain-containing protein [Nitrospiraceae bacterium]